METQEGRIPPVVEDCRRQRTQAKKELPGQPARERRGVGDEELHSGEGS